ncbi:MAG: TRAP transporter small permease, partial [Pseudomonadota bacterium]
MDRIARGAERALDGLAALAMALASALLVVLIVIFGWLVYGRYVLNATPTWVEQSALLIV